MAEKLGLSLRSIAYHLKNLRRDGILIRTGSDKNGEWVVGKSAEITTTLLLAPSLIFFPEHCTVNCDALGEKLRTRRHVNLRII